MALTEQTTKQQCQHLSQVRIGNSNLVKCTSCGKVKYTDFGRTCDRCGSTKAGCCQPHNIGDGVFRDRRRDWLR